MHTGIMQPTYAHEVAAPELSVVMPVHADHPYLNEAVCSVLEQSHQCFELLIVVNGQAQELAEKLRTRYLEESRVRVLYTPMPGLPFALNLGIAAAYAEIIVRMDSDDVCEPERLARVHETLSANPDIGVLGSAFSVIDEHGRILQPSKLRAFDDRTLRRLMPFRCALRHPTVALRRPLALRVGGYSYGAFSEDYDLWLRLRRDRNVRFHVLGESLLRYRRHTAQATSPRNNLTIFAYDVTLKLRELLITLNPVFLAGATFSVIDLGYKYFAFARVMLRKLGRKSLQAR